MKKEYDFSKAERGRFFKKGTTLRLPIYLDANVQHEVENLASRTGRNVRDVVNRIVQKEVRLIEELKSSKEA
jgi:cytidylate kinase